VPVHRRIPAAQVWASGVFPRPVNVAESILGLSNLPQQEGNCYGLGDGMFPRYRAEVAVAKRVCVGCPITAACLELGMDEEYGVWGGLTASERTALRTPAAG
jgi:hypothetical protein